MEILANLKTQYSFRIPVYVFDVNHLHFAFGCEPPGDLLRGAQLINTPFSGVPNAAGARMLNLAQFSQSKSTSKLNGSRALLAACAAAQRGLSSSLTIFLIAPAS